MKEVLEIILICFFSSLPLPMILLCMWWRRKYRPTWLEAYQDAIKKKEKEQLKSLNEE